ncbi:redoxin domain-containing protein [Streptomyces sp. NPDC048825]|uniref:redoxin domain-containing protein n=1 Tax=Streptomyces sp. NPDC048825 TaxID=3365592 RepID=UPI00371C5923
MRARLILPGLLAITALTLVGCGTEKSATSSGAAENSPTTSGSSAPAQAGAGTAAVPEALRFTGTTVDGKPFDAATLAGKPTVLWFWAPWCPKCRAQASETAKVATEYQDKAHVLGVAGLDKNAAMKDFVSQTGTGSFPHLSDEAGEVWKRFEVTEQSHYVILDKDGKTVYEGVLPGGEGLAEKVAGLTG